MLHQGAHQVLELVDALADASCTLLLRSGRVGAGEGDPLTYAGVTRQLTIASYPVDAVSVSVGTPAEGDGVKQLATKWGIMGDVLATPAEGT